MFGLSNWCPGSLIVTLEVPVEPFQTDSLQWLFHLQLYSASISLSAVNNLWKKCWDIINWSVDDVYLLLCASVEKKHDSQRTLKNEATGGGILNVLPCLSGFLDAFKLAPSDFQQDYLQMQTLSLVWQSIMIIKKKLIRRFTALWFFFAFLSLMCWMLWKICSHYIMLICRKKSARHQSINWSCAQAPAQS